jgi:NADH-quinone oxidoreductase subunit G
MAKIFIDGKEYEVDGSQNLLHVALSLKLDLPYFCWHPAIGSVGACRQCAVIQYKDENDTNRQDHHGLHDAGSRWDADLH